MVRYLFVAVLSLPVLASEIDDIRNLVTGEKYDDAYKLANGLSAKLAGSPEFDFLYGLAAQSSGHSDVAVLALDRVILKDPENANAYYEKALALIDVGDLASAKTALEKTLTLKVQDDVKADVQSLLKTLDEPSSEKKRRSEIWADISASAGYNSNIDAGAPGFSEFPAQSPAVMDGFGEVELSMMAKRFFNKTDAIFFSFASNDRKYFRSTEWDFNVFAARFGGEMSFGKWQIRMPIDTEIALTSYIPVRLSASVGSDVRYSWSDSSSSLFGFRVALRTYGDAANNQIGIPLSLRHSISGIGDKLDLDLGISYAPAIALANVAGSSVMSSLAGNFSAEYEFLDSHFLTPSLGLSYLHFPQNLDQTGSRDDFNLLAEIGYEWHFIENWILSPSFVYIFNTSTDTGQTYSRYEILLGLRCHL